MCCKSLEGNSSLFYACGGTDGTRPDLPRANLVVGDVCSGLPHERLRVNTLFVRPFVHVDKNIKALLFLKKLFLINVISQKL